MPFDFEAAVEEDEGILLELADAPPAMLECDEVGWEVKLLFALVQNSRLTAWSARLPACHASAPAARGRGQITYGTLTPAR